MLTGIDFNFFSFLAEGGVKIESLDLIVIAVYFIGIVGIGLWAGRKRKDHVDSDSYFRAGGTLTWPMIGLALFSTNISTIHMVGFAGQGYKTGLAFGNYEWMAPFLLIVLALFFAPFYLKSKVATLPDFLEKRYCKTCRNWLAGLSIVSAVFIHIGFTLYTGALVIKTLFDIPIFVSIVAASVLTGIYTVVGGLLAVVVTGALQTIILLAGSIVLTIIAFVKIGGWGAIFEFVEPAKMTIMRPTSDMANLPWYSVLLGYPVIGLWYWCADQTIVQRVLGAKDSNHARTGPLFAGFLKVLPVFIFFLPGLIFLALVNRGDFAPLSNPDECFSQAILKLLPVGVTGLMAAALMAALMSTISGAMNSIATLVSFDLYKQWKPNASDKLLVFTGQAATVFFMLVAIVWSYYIKRFGSVYQGCVDLISYIAPPITTVFFFGVFWKRASNRAAIWTMALGSAMGLTVFIIDWNDYFNWSMPGLLAGFWLFCACSVVMIVATLIWPHKHTEESLKLVWKNPLEALKDKGWPGMANYKFLSLALFVTMVLCYMAFLKPKPLPAVETAAVDTGLRCSVYESRASNIKEFLFAEDKPKALKAATVTDISTQSDLTADSVTEYKGFFQAPQTGFYQFKLTSAHKMDIRLDKVTLTLYDTTSGPDKDKALVRNYTAQVHLEKGKHDFMLFFYSSDPWNAFKLKDSFGNKIEEEVQRQQQWLKKPRQFKFEYIPPGQKKPIAIPGGVFTN